RGAERRGKVVERRRRRRPGAAGGSGPRGRAVTCGARDRVEVEGELQALAAERTGPDRPPRAPARRPLRADPRGRDGPAGRDVTERLDLRGGILAGHRGQPLDEGPELVLAEEADHRLAVVVGEPSGLEVERDRQVADDRRQLAAPKHGLSILDELLAQLVGLDLVDPLVELIEAAELG